MTNPLNFLTRPRLPLAAIALSSKAISAVSLDRRRNLFIIRRAGYSSLPQDLLNPNFDASNVLNAAELAREIEALLESVGMEKRYRWSVALPEAATRTSIITIESPPDSRTELEEMLRWKIERTFGTAFEDLRTTRHRIERDSQRARYIVDAIRLPVLAEYEDLFSLLELRAGMILPGHQGEAYWLMRRPVRAVSADSLLLSSHESGFTALLVRQGHPFLVRSIMCEEEDRADELYRFLLFYRDRFASPRQEEEDSGHADLEEILVAGNGFGTDRAAEIMEETLSLKPKVLGPGDVGLSLPDGDLEFGMIAAPSGLAALGWS